MTVTLINRSGRCLALNLPHRVVCTESACLCTPPRDPRGRAVCRSITLPAGHATTALPEAVLAALGKALHEEASGTADDDTG